MALTELIKKMSEDKEFEAKYRELDSIDAYMEQAARDGYSITSEDVEMLRIGAEFNENGCAELSDEMMEDVAGGTNPINPPRVTTLPYNPSNPPNVTTLPQNPTTQTAKIVKL